MKKVLLAISIIALTMLCVSSAGNHVRAQEDIITGSDPAVLVDRGAVFYLQTAELKKLLSTVEFIKKNLLTEETVRKIEDNYRGFKKKTGIDLMDPASLEKAGVDTGRPAAFAYLSPDGDKERIVILIPIRDEQKFPSTFVSILKKARGEDSAKSIETVVTSYKGHAVYRVLKDLFFTTVGGYLAIAPSGNIVSNVVDIHKSGKPGSNLTGDAHFSDYRSKQKNIDDCAVYMNVDFFKELDKRKKKKSPDASSEGKNNVPGEKADSLDGSDKLPQKGTSKRFPALSEDTFDSVQYVTAGLRRKDNGISLEIGVSVDRNSVPFGVISRILKSGIPSNILLTPRPIAYYYLAFNIGAFNDLCKSGDPRYNKLCMDYRKQLDEIGSKYGINIKRDFLPYFGGYFNMATRSSRVAGKIDNFVFFIPMSDEKQGKAFWKTLMRTAEKNRKEETFGRERIDNIPSFWYRDAKGNKISVLFYRKGIYASNNIEFLRSNLGQTGLPTKDPGIGYMRHIDEQTFFVLYLNLQDESYTKTMLSLLLYKSGPHVSRVMNKINELLLMGRNDEAYYSMSIRIQFTDDTKE